MAEKKAKSSSSPKKRWKFEFGVFGMIGLGMVGTLVMAWAFILGILVGRGYSPESVIPELGRIVSPQPPTITTAPPLPVLRPEELRFHEALQERGSQPFPKAPRRTDPPRPLSSPQAAPQEQSRPEDQTQTQPRPQPVPEAPPVSAEIAPALPRFEFVYQAASFQSSAQARSLQQRMVSAGLFATVEDSIVNGRQWHRVLVTVRGSQSDADNVKNQLKGLGVADPFLRVKKNF